MSTLPEVKEALLNMHISQLNVIDKFLSNLISERSDKAYIRRFLVLWNYMEDALMEYDEEIDIQEGKNIKSSTYRRIFIYMMYKHWMPGLSISAISEVTGFERSSINKMIKDVDTWLKLPGEQGRASNNALATIGCLYEEYFKNEE